MEPTDQSEKAQQLHYDAIAVEYERHYGDAWSQSYRNRFINKSLFENLDLSGMEVLEAMCGTGQTTGFLLEHGARVTALDISEVEIKHFEERWPTCNARCGSIFSSGLESDRFDCVVVVGGLHHLQPKVPEAIREIRRILKVGGYLCFMEPHKGSLPDKVREFWYRRDALFADNEAAVDLTELKREFSGDFTFLKEDYKGSIAYLLVLNSMVFRIPLRLKPFYSPLLLWLESAIEKAQNSRLSCVVVCQWKKRW